MSSHHIIREKQEPALFILSLESFSSEYLGQLLEWSPTVVVTAENYEQIDSLGIKIDAIVAPEKELLSQPLLKLVKQQNTPLYDGLSFLADEGYPAVNIITNTFNIADYLSFIDRINLVIYLSDHKIFSAGSGFSKWKEAGEKIELLQLPAGLQTTGLTPVDEQVYETTGDGFYMLRFSGNAIFVKERL